MSYLIKMLEERGEKDLYISKLHPILAKNIKTKEAAIECADLLIEYLIQNNSIKNLIPMVKHPKNAIKKSNDLINSMLKNCFYAEADTGYDPGFKFKEQFQENCISNMER